MISNSGVSDASHDVSDASDMTTASSMSDARAGRFCQSGSAIATDDIANNVTVKLRFMRKASMRPRHETASIPAGRPPYDPACQRCRVYQHNYLSKPCAISR